MRRIITLVMIMRVFSDSISKTIVNEEKDDEGQTDS